MRLSGSFIAPSLLGLAAAAAPQARVFVQDLDAPAHLGTQTAPTLSPDTARLIFAQRLGLSQYHSLKHTDDDTIQYINDFGGSRHQLFDDDQLGDEAKHVMLVVEGVKDTAVLDSASFSLSETPGADATSRLLEDFSIQSEHLFSTAGASNKDTIPKAIKNVLDKVSEDVETRLSNGILLAHIRNSDNTDYSSTIRELADLCSSKWPLTVAVMPPSSGSVSKRSANAWGEYEVPKRSAMTDRKRPEAILAEVPDNDFTQRVNRTDALKAPKSPNNATIKGILPACFSSKDACESATNDCSGRGSCVKKYTDKDNNNKACYTCKCKAQVRTNKDGSKKTTYYGGPACQKKDVVMPFWLFTGFAVAMAFLLSYGIGLLYTMGNEELPSVIGAGVSGASSRR
ncbi:putative endoplasmic reticulum membrane protein [Lasiodiplodia theobromae]|uniref:Putative endoplasmic reticulum membrane protein n=1 Tax=Lasiodiplodia theobromae TaxID=45133 RepID=A0A5N5DBE3_9PEZI|nr:putative endoplasmic reticulum membrane protein [Lasiodiplodia theobromae]